MNFILDGAWFLKEIETISCLTMLRFELEDDFVEIELVQRETADLPSCGDVRVAIRISSAGFTGHNDLWVVGSAWRHFCKALVTLEHNRRGEAVLDSISPDELHLVIRSVDSRGHMIIEGFTGYAVMQENSQPWHSVRFGFEFDPQQLLRAANVDWLKATAAEPV